MFRLRHSPAVSSLGFSRSLKLPSFSIAPYRFQHVLRFPDQFQNPRGSFVRQRSLQMKDSTSNLDTHVLPPLLIIGTGVLGTYLGKLWVDNGGHVTGETNTTNSHERLKSLGIYPRTKEDRNSDRFPLVVFCAPPSGSPDYLASVQEALELWDGTGIFIFTSSTGVHPPSNIPITEDSPTFELGENPRADKIIYSEKFVSEAHGCIVRLSGLYNALRGPHSFFFSKGECNRPPNEELNLIHYEDVATLLFQVLKEGKKFKNHILLATGKPTVSFKALLESSMESGLYQGDIKATGDDSISGPTKQLDNSKTLDLLEHKWRTNFTFEDLMKNGGNDWYKSSGLW